MKNNMQFALGLLGRHASSALPLGVLVGLFVPYLADSFQPLLIPALFVPLTLSLVRIETYQLRSSLLRWHWVALLSVWILILRPAAVWAILQFFTLPEPIVKAVLITAAAPPVTACAAIAIFLGVDAAMVVVVTIATMLLVPLSLPPMVYYLVDLQIFVVSTLLVLGSYVIATVLFWRLGPGTAMAIGLVSGNCNMGLMYLILVDQATLDVLIFFAIGQIPMYFLPSLLAPLINRLLVRTAPCRTPHKGQ